jgi:hypothetical protein
MGLLAGIRGGMKLRSAKASNGEPQSSVGSSSNSVGTSSADKPKLGFLDELTAKAKKSAAGRADKVLDPVSQTPKKVYANPLAEALANNPKFQKVNRQMNGTPDSVDDV